MRPCDKRHVYFFKPVGMAGPIKIGCSEMPNTRLERFAVWSPFDLEMIGYVRGSFADELFLHSAFSESHSHREWFNHTPELESAIAKIIAAGTVDAVRDELSAKGPIRKYTGRRNSPEKREYVRYRMKTIWAEKKLRKQGERTMWHAPYDVTAILNAWCQRTEHGGSLERPTATEMARIEEYLADPVKHSVYPEWFEKKAAA